jgi:predicted TIM-barrel enzyme
MIETMELYGICSQSFQETLEKTEGAITNGQSKDTGNIWAQCKQTKNHSYLREVYTYLE